MEFDHSLLGPSPPPLLLRLEARRLPLIVPLLFAATRPRRPAPLIRLVLVAGGGGGALSPTRLLVARGAGRGRGVAIVMATGQQTASLHIHRDVACRVVLV